MIKFHLKLVLQLILIVSSSSLFAQLPNYISEVGLVGYWPFDGNVTDLSENGNHGVSNGATLTTDRFNEPNSAYLFNGSSNFISIQTSNSLQNIGSITISAWININDWFNDGNEGYFPIICKSNLQSTYGKYSLNLRTGGAIGHLNSWENGINYPSWNFGEWNHVVMAIGNDSTKFYVDNELIWNGPTGVFPNSFSNSLPLIFGRDATGLDEFANGKIDDIGIWNRLLTSNEISNLFNGSINNPSCQVINSVTLNAQTVQGTVSNVSVGYLPNSQIAVPDTSQWHYIALTKSGQTGTFYLDGTQIVSTSFASNPYIWNSLLLGASQACVSCTAEANFMGQIDEVRVSNIARTPSQVSSYYSSNTQFTSDANTIGLFHLETNGATTSNTVGSNADVYGSPLLVNGKFGQALKFNGTSDYVRWPNSIPTNNMSLEFWFKSSDLNATVAMLEYAYNTGINLQGDTATLPILWSNGATTSSTTVDPNTMPFIAVNNGQCTDTVFFNSTSSTILDTLFSTVTFFDTIVVNQIIYDTLYTTVYDTVLTTIYDTLLTTVTDTLLIDLITGLLPPNEVGIIKIFPNPSLDYMTIDYGSFEALSGFSLSILNNSAQVVFSTNVNQQQSVIDVSNWASGLYTVIIYNSEGNPIENKSIIIQ